MSSARAAARSTMARLAVFASGEGSNLQALLDACAGGALDAQVVLVVVNHRQAKAIDRARAAQVPVSVQPWSTPLDSATALESRRAWEQQLCETVCAAAADLVVLAGWDRLLVGPLLEDYADRIINLHPALPGVHPGMRAVERAHRAFLAGGPAQTGVMVHRVTSELDAGPVVAQELIPLAPGESLEQLRARVQVAEHRLLVRAVALELAAGKSRLDRAGLR